MKKVTIDTPEKKAIIDSITDRMAETIETSTSLIRKLESGDVLTDEEIDNYVDAANNEEIIAKELKDFIEEYGR
jgi:hypothetical protein